MNCPACEKEIEDDEGEILECFHVLHFSCSKKITRCPKCFRDTDAPRPTNPLKAKVLTKEVKRIILSLNAKKNVVLQGPGGTGKSYSIQVLRDFCIMRGVKIMITALTGVAAMNIGGRTLHSWAGHGLLDKPAEYYLKSHLPKKNILTTDILVIDEASMLDIKTFELLDLLCKRYRKNEELFGGIRLIFSCDPLQLPPVTGKMFFFSKLFRTEDFDIHTFYTPKRYPDLDYFEFLLRIRKGEPTIQDFLFLESKSKKFSSSSVEDLKVEPTVMYSKRTDVDSMNISKMNSLPTKEFVFKAEDYATDPDHKKILATLAPEVVKMKVGCQVMHTVNNETLSLVNGSRGVVTKLTDFEITVRYFDERVITHSRHPFTFRVTKSLIISRLQFPFILAWATTIHKSQGSTLDCAICDLGDSVFCAGQSYVALSRVKTAAGLFISAFDRKSIKADKENLDLVNLLEEKSVPVIC